MKKKNAKGLFIQIIVGANIATASMMFLTGYSYLVNPLKFSVVGICGLFFPFFLVINIAFLAFWLVFYWRKAYIPVLSLLVCYLPVRTYIGINASADVPKDAIKVMSYNVLGLHGFPDKPLSRDSNEIAQYLYDEDCDIVCLQESNECWLSDSCRDHMLEHYPYHREDARFEKGTKLAIYSKYKILSADSILYNSKGNLSMVYTLQIGKREVYVINNYFEVSHLTLEDRENFSSMMRGKLNNDSARVESKSVVAKLIESSLIRTPQAQAVANFIKEHSDKPIILTGDFNDNPISYTHYAIAKTLTDCFVESGKGFGWSYCHNAMRVRIDNIMCSKEFTPYNCQVDNKIPYSDHYPMKCWLKID